MHDPDCYEAERVALQLITPNAEIHQNPEGTRPITEQDFLNL